MLLLGPDVVSVLDQHGDGSTQEAARLQSAWFAQSLHKTTPVSRVNGSRLEFDASSVGAKVREGLTDGANKIFDVLYQNYHGDKANIITKILPSLKCSVATEPPVDAE